MNVATSDLLSDVAVTATDPDLSAVTAPPFTDATDGSDVVHVTTAATIGFASASNTVAVNVRTSPIDDTLAVFGAIVTVAATCFTTTFVCAESPSAVIVTAAVPLFTAVTRPVWSTVRIVGSLDL